MGESLLPLPGGSQSPEKRKWRVGWILLTAAFLIQFHINMWYLHHHHTGPKPPPNPPNPQWPAEAVQAARLAASHWCSGNGNVFADTLAVNTDGTPLCECDECFSGPDCSVAVPACIADADRSISRPPWASSHLLSGLVFSCTLPEAAFKVDLPQMDALGVDLSAPNSCRKWNTQSVPDD